MERELHHGADRLEEHARYIRSLAARGGLFKIWLADYYQLFIASVVLVLWSLVIPLVVKQPDAQVSDGKPDTH